jgi:site-specific recombinase XerC
MRDATIHDINELVKQLEADMHRRREELGRPNPWDVENRLTVIKSVFRYAHDMGYIPTNPAAGVKPPKGTDRERGEYDAHDAVRILTDPQAEKLHALLRARVAAGGVEARKVIGIALGQFAALRGLR